MTTTSVIESLSPAARRVADRIADPIERELWAAHNIAGNELDAAHDGALHHVYDGADAMVRAIEHEYRRTAEALAAYRNR